MPKDFKA